MEQMERLLLALLTPLVEHPCLLTIAVFNGEKSISFEIKCASGDSGRIIGKKGKTIKAIRHLFKAIGRRQGKIIHLEIVGKQDNLWNRLGEKPNKEDKENEL